MAREVGIPQSDGVRGEDSPLRAPGALGEWVRALLAASSRAAVLALVADALERDSGADYVLVSEQLEEQAAVRIAEVRGFGAIAERLLASLGYDPRTIPISLSSMPDADRESFGSGRLRRYDRGLAGLACGTLSPRLARLAEGLLGIRRIDTIGFAWEGRLFGGVSLLFRDDGGPRDVESIELLAGLAAVVLQRLAAEGAHRRSEERLRALFDGARDAVSMSKDARFVMVNSAFASMFGYERPSSLVGVSVLDIIAPSERARIDEYMQRRLDGISAPEAYDTLGVRRDGTEFEMDVRVSMTPWGGESLTLAILRDITERKQIEREAQDWKRRYDLVAAASGQIMYEYSAADGAIAWSGSVEQVLGSCPDEMCGGVAQWVDGVHPDDRESVVQALEAAEARGGSYIVEYRFRHRDGHFVPILDQGVAVLDGWGRTERVVGLMQDVSASRRTAERERRAAERTRFLLDLHVRSGTLSDREVIEHALEEAVRLTGSVIGYAHRFDAASGTVTLTAWSRSVLDFCVATPDQHYFLEAAGVWADCVRLGHPVVHNDYAALPTKRGQPEGHANIIRHMSVPVPGACGVQLILGVGNKPRNYDEEDVVELQVIANELEKLLAARQAAESLRASEELYRTLVTASPDAILILDGEGRMRYASPKAVGLARADGEASLLGRCVFDWIAPEDRQRARDNFATVLTKKEVRGSRYRLAREDGSVFWADIGAAPLLEASGVVNGMIAVTRDVSDRIVAEEELRQSEARWRALGESAPAIIATVGKDRRILSLNRLPAGWTSERIQGMRADEFFPSEAREEVVQALARAFGGERTSFESDATLPGDGRTSFFLSVGPVIRNEEVVAAVVLGIDVTARREAERERERLQAQLIELQKMDAVGRLAGGIAHDFNNLLTAILGHSDLALGELDEISPAFENLKGIQDVVEQARALTHQILAFGRRQVLRMVDADLNREVESAVRLLRRLIPESIDINTHLAASLPPVRADVSQIQQVLLNLAINGRDAMPAGGRLSLGTSRVVLGEDEVRSIPEARLGHYVCLVVTDTGAGMDEATALRVFEPFFTTKDVGHGTGLGLATVYGIVRQHGGFVRVESALGAGSTFTVFLPASESRDASLVPTEATLASGRGNETILVVEDEALVRGPLVRQLTAFGYVVLAAPGPIEALEVARQHGGPIHLLLTDVVMPDMDGRALHGRLVAERPGLPAIFMSGYSGDILVREGGALREGLQFIQKPFGIGELTRRIRDILDETGAGVAPATDG